MFSIDRTMLLSAVHCMTIQVDEAAEVEAALKALLAQNEERERLLTAAEEVRACGLVVMKSGDCD